MAEQFDKPKLFTKDWFEYVWHYYKVHLICVAIAILLVVITVIESINTVHYDGNINVISANAMSTDVATKLSDAAEAYVMDLNEDGETHVSVTQLAFTSEAMQDGNQLMALENKLMTLFASPDEMLFIFDEMMLRDVLSISATEGIFLPVHAWCEAEIPEDKLYMFENEPCAVKLSDSAVLHDLGVDASELYVAVRMNYDLEDEELTKTLKNCISFANALVKS